VGGTHSTDRQDSGLHVPMLSDLPFILAQTSFAIILACVDLAFVFFLCHTVNYGDKQGQGIWKVYKTYGLTVTLSCSVLYGQYQWCVHYLFLLFSCFLWCYSPNHAYATLLLRFLDHIQLDTHTWYQSPEQVRCTFPDSETLTC